MPKPPSSEWRDCTVGFSQVTFKAPRELTTEEANSLMAHLKREAEYAAKRWVEAEMTESGCWCYGLSHREDCRHWTLPR